MLQFQRQVEKALGLIFQLLLNDQPFNLKPLIIAASVRKQQTNNELNKVKRCCRSPQVKLVYPEGVGLLKVTRLRVLVKFARTNLKKG